MHEKNNTLALHAEIAHAIKSAKKLMFKRHREGVPLRIAADNFCTDIALRLKEVVPDSPNGGSRALNCLGVKPEVSPEDVVSETELQRAKAEAKHVEDFLNTDFLHSSSGDIWGKLIVTPPMIVQILVHAASTDDDMEVSQ